MKKQLSAISYQLSGKARGISHFLKAESSQLKAQPQRGFTLIEMLVSIALFAIVMVVCVGALLALVGANKKAQALESTMNNLNISLDDMVRNLREGSNFNGLVGCMNPSSTSGDCTEGGTPGTGNQLQFTTYAGATWTYWLQSGQIYKKTVTGSVTEESPVTSPDVSITDLEFYVVGSSPSDDIQPRVIITIDGSAGAANNVKDSTAFHLQATAVQRALDL